MGKRHKSATASEIDYPIVSVVERGNPLRSILVQAGERSRLTVQASNTDADELTVSVYGYLSAAHITLDRKTARRLHELLGQMLSESWD